MTFEGGTAVPSQLPPQAQVRIELPEARLGGAGGVVQAVLPSGEVVAPPGQARLPVDRRTVDVAAGRREPFFRDATVDGVHVRVLTPPGLARDALLIARPLTEVDATLDRLRWILLAVTLGGAGLAALLAAGVARATVGPVARLTRATEQVTETGELHHRIDASGDDEVARLAASFNTMLAALQRSRDAQRQLVADASHELRTPLTSIRANLELLERARDSRTGSGTRCWRARAPSSRSSPCSSATSSTSPARARSSRPRPRTCAWTSSSARPWSARAGTPTAASRSAWRPRPAWCTDVIEIASLAAAVMLSLLIGFLIALYYGDLQRRMRELYYGGTL